MTPLPVSSNKSFRAPKVVRRSASGSVVATITFALLFIAGAALTSLADDWLPVPPEDLALKDNAAQPGSDAMVLYRRSHVDAARASIDGQFDLEYMRIKIFTQRGVDEESTVRIPYWKGDWEVRDIHARTIKPDGTIVNFDGQIFDRLVEGSQDGRFLEKAFTMPQVTPGAIVEYRYRLSYKPEYVFNNDWTVSSRLFTRDAEFSMVPAPANSSLEPILYFRTTGLPQGALPQRQGNGNYIMTIHNLPGIVEEPLMPGRRTIEGRVEFFYRNAGAPKNESTEQFWARIGKFRSDEVDKFVSKKGPLQQAVAETVTASDTPEQKLQKLYARAQKIPNMSYQPEKSAAELKKEGVKNNANVEDVIKHNYASEWDVNALFIGLARTAGFDAQMVYVAPRNQEVFLPNGQALGQLRNNLVWVKVGDKEYWVDPSAKYYPFGLLPWSETETQGIRVSGSGSQLITTPQSPSADATQVRTADVTVQDDGSAQGKFSISFNGIQGAEQRSWTYHLDETARHKQFQKDVEGMLPPGSSVELASLANFDDNTKPLVLEGTLTVPTYASVAGHRMLVPSSLFLTSYRTVFASEKRMNAVRFSHRDEEIDDVMMHAPAGFTVEALPPARQIKAATSFTYDIATTDNKGAVEVKRHFVMNDVAFPRESYPALRGFFQNVKTVDETQVVLSGTAQAKAN